MPKTLKQKLLFIDFSKAFDSKLRGKVEQILLDTITAIMMLYSYTKVKVSSTDGNKYF